jgi:hypothetical protein
MKMKFISGPLAMAVVIFLSWAARAQPVAPPPAGPNAGNEPIQTISFDDVDPFAAVQTLARQARLNIQFDPKIGGQKDGQGGTVAPPRVTLKWSNVTARDALQTLVDQFGWRMVPNPRTRITLITLKETPSAETGNAVPMISSGVAGPLGVLHLPRLWLKLSLESRGKLGQSYSGRDKIFDQMVLDGLGLKREAVLDFVKISQPSYPEFETWIKSQSGVKLDKGSIRALNASIATYAHPDGVRKAILDANGITDDAKAPRNAIDLNNLDDWRNFHAAALK